MVSRLFGATAQAQQRHFFDCTPNGDGSDISEQSNRQDEKTTTLRRARRKTTTSDLAQTED